MRTNPFPKMKFHPAVLLRAAAIAAGLAIPVLCAAATAQTAFKFDFTPGPAPAGFIQVTPDMAYSSERGYGFDLGSKVVTVSRASEPLRDGFSTSDRPFFFSAAVPEGNYQISVTFGDAGGATTNTVKAETRRLMLEQVVTAPGKFETRVFTVNVRGPRLANGGQVGLKKREAGPPMVLHWDDKLTLEFNGARPGLCALEIAPVTNAITVFLAGDSTVTDQPEEPWNSWGQMLTRFFQPGVAVANYAESGESLKSSRGARRFDKILGTLRTNDYLFIQFGHNDQKDKTPGAGAFTSYKTNLMRLVAEARQRGGIPVVVTSMERKAGVNKDTLGDFAAAVRQVSREENVPLIDLHAMSKTLYAALGTNLDRAFQDGTHHNAYGSYELARCVVEGIKADQLPLAKFLGDDVPPFDPSHPDPVASFHIPPSPQSSAQKPEGN